MAFERQISVRIYEGPNLVVPYGALIAEFTSPFLTVLPGAQIAEILKDLFGAFDVAAAFPDSADFDFAGLVAQHAHDWQEIVQPLGLRKASSQSQDGAARIALEFFSAGRARTALHAGLEMANAVFVRAADGNADVSGMIGRVREYARNDNVAQFASVSNAYILAARKRGIFVRQISPLANILKYGQGAKGFHQREAIRSSDSFIGHRLTQDKSSSNQLIRQLGFPGVEHGVVVDLPAARRVAGQLGVPLVVKPVDRNGSTGVTVGIDTPQELEAAFLEAKRESNSGRILVERYVPGHDHRLTVFDGKLFRASKLVIAQVSGDGIHTIRQLIDTDNERRRKAAAAGDYLFELSLDQKMTALIRKQGFAPESVPPAGTAIRLAGTSNLKSGGHREDVTRFVHPENAAMAEAIARNLRLDAVGIDFITEDISKPWTEGRCAIIEVNANPGTSYEVADEAVAARFPDGKDGRIPSVLIVGGGRDLTTEIAARLARGDRRVGWTHDEETELAGGRRFLGAAELPARILGLLLDADCEALVVGCAPADIEKYGLPHTRFDLAIIAGPEAVPEPVSSLIEQNAMTCLALRGIDGADGKLASLIDSL